MRYMLNIHNTFRPISFLRWRHKKTLISVRNRWDLEIGVYKANTRGLQNRPITKIKSAHTSPKLYYALLRAADVCFYCCEFESLKMQRIISTDQNDATASNAWISFRCSIVTTFSKCKIKLWNYCFRWLHGLLTLYEPTTIRHQQACNVPMLHRILYIAGRSVSFVNYKAKYCRIYNFQWHSNIK